MNATNPCVLSAILTPASAKSHSRNAIYLFLLKSNLLARELLISRHRNMQPQLIK